MVESVGQAVLERARALSFPRYPGTEGDRRAIAMVARELGQAGLEVREEEFSYDLEPARRALQAVMVGCGLAVAASGWLVLLSPTLALALFALAALAGGTFLSWAPWMERIYRREGPTRTANVVGRRAAKPPRMTLILMAHHDSKSQNLTLPWRLGLTLVALAGSLHLALALVAAVAGWSPPGPPWLAGATASAAAVALFVLATLRNGNLSPGGVDNAGSVGIVMELARSLPARVPEDVELVFLSPGAEEDHMVGAMRWLDRHLPELEGRPVFTLNFDGAGNPGRLVVMERYGFGRRFSRLLSQVVRRAAASVGDRVLGIVTPPAMGIDAIPFAHRGLPSITFSSGSLGPGTVGVHSARDLPEHLDAATLQRVVRLAEATVDELVRLRHDDGSR